MPDQNELIQVTGMQEALNELSFLESLGVNNDYLVPGMRSLGGKIKPVERGKVPVFSGATGKSLTSKVTQNGVGAVTLTVGPNSKRRHIFRFISGGAQWHDRGAAVSTWRGRERNRFLGVSTFRGGTGKKTSRKLSQESSYIPVKSLLEWVQKKLGASAENALHVAFAVAKSIGRKGLQAKPIVPPTVSEISDMVVSSINEVIHRMVEELHNHGK
ncbi:MAG: hypothetical protein AB9897_01310 [Anaerolineaceae bacterium]